MLKEKVKETILWVIGVFFILTFVVYINQIVLPSTLILIAGILLLPTINKIINKKIQNEDYKKYYKISKIILVIIFTLVFMANVPTNNGEIKNNDREDKISSEKEIINTTEELDKNKIDESISRIITETNGTYTGERIDGKKQGIGTYKWNDGAVYEGEFDNDQINGSGALTIPEKGTYNGTFVNGKRSGQGIYTFTNGDKYEGNWENDKMSGQGTYTFADGDTYVGEFKDNKFNGQGTYTKGSNKYTGTWTNNEYKK